jgi:hypothetical protein
MAHKKKSKKPRKMKLPDPQIFAGGEQDEAQYRQWIADNELGYVINFRSDYHWLKLHRATCGSINIEDRQYTATCYKACSLFTPVLRAWAKEHSSNELLMCQHCID